VAGLNVIVAGGTQAGKTTLLNCLAGAIPAKERVVTCEEVFELSQSKLGRILRTRPLWMTLPAFTCNTAAAMAQTDS